MEILSKKDGTETAALSTRAHVVLMLPWLILFAERNIKDFMIKELQLEKVLNRNVEDLSGGELQRFAIAVTCVQEADMYAVHCVCSCCMTRARMRLCSLESHSQVMSVADIIPSHSIL